MANDAEVKIKVGTQLDKNSVKADVSSIGVYLKDTEHSVNNVSKAYNKMPKTMSDAIRTQKQLNASIYRFKTILFDVYDTMRKVDSTDFSAFDASIKRVLPDVQKLKAEIGWAIGHFSKMGTPEKDAKGFEARLDTLKSMESILHSIYTAWYNIEKAWGSDTDKLAASADGVRNFLETLKSADTIPLFKNISSEVREMSATMKASEAAYASNMKAFRDAVASGSRDAEQLLKLYNSVYNTQALLVDKSNVPTNGVLEQHKPLLLTMKEERDVLEDINKHTSNNGKEVDIKVGAKLDANAISRVVKEAESAIGKQNLKTTFYDNLSKVTSDLASNTEKSTSLMGDYDRLIEDVLSKLTQIKNSDALSAVLKDSQKYVKSFGDVLSKVETGIFSVKGNDYSGFTYSLDESIDSIRVLNAYVGQLALSFDKMYTESGAGVKYVVPEISDVQTSLIKVSNILSTLEDTYDKLHVKTGDWTTSTKSLSNTLGTVRDLFKEITADPDADILQRVSKSDAIRSVKPMSMTTGLTDITNVFKDVTALTKDMDTPGIFFGEIPYKVKDFVTQLDKLGISVKQINSELINTTASVNGLINEVSKTSEKVSEVQEKVKDTGKAASDVSLEKVGTQLDTVKEKAKETSEQLSKAGEDAKSVQVAEVKKPITIAPTEEQYKDARREIESMIDETDRGTAELNKWQRTMMNAFKVFFDEFSRINNAIQSQDFTGYIDDDLNKLFAKVKTSVLLIQEFTQRHILEGNALSKMMTNYLNNIGYTTRADKEDFKKAFDYTSISSFKKTLEKMLKDYTTAANKLQELKEAEEQAAQSAEALGTETTKVDASKPVEQTKELKENVTEVATATKEASTETKKALTEEEQQALEAKKAVQELKDELRAAVLDAPDNKLPEAWRVAAIKAFTQFYSTYIKFADLIEKSPIDLVLNYNLDDLEKELRASASVIEDFFKTKYSNATSIKDAKDYALKDVLGKNLDIEKDVEGYYNQLAGMTGEKTYLNFAELFAYKKDEYQAFIDDLKSGKIAIKSTQKDVKTSSEETTKVVTENEKKKIEAKEQELALTKSITDVENSIVQGGLKEGTAELKKALAERTKLRKKQLSSDENSVDSTSQYKDTYKDTLKSIDRKTRKDDAAQDLETQIKLRKEIAKINRSTATEEQKNQRILEAQEASAKESDYKTSLRQLDARSQKYLAFIELWKKTALATEEEIKTKALGTLEAPHNSEMAKIEAAQLALDDKAQYLPKSLLDERQAEIDKRKKAEMDDYELKKSNLLKINDLAIKQIKERSEAAKDAVESSTTNRKNAEKLSYLDSLGKTSTPTTSTNEDKSYKESLKRQEDAYVNYLDRRSSIKRAKLDADYDYELQLNKSLDSYKSTISGIESNTAFSKRSDDAQEELRLKKEIAEIQSSTDSRAIKNARVLEAERKSALKTEHADNLRNINARQAKSLATLDLIKRAEEAKSQTTYNKDMSFAENRYKANLSYVNEELQALEDNRSKLSAEEYDSQKKELLTKKQNIKDAYDSEKSEIKKTLDASLRSINTKYDRIKTKIGERTSNATLSENIRYDNVSGIDNLGLDKSKAGLETLKAEISKVANLFSKAMNKAWTSYVRYGKGAINTISNLFKSTLQKTYQGTLKITEVMGLRGGVKDVNSVTDALGKLKSQLLGIAGVSISFRSLFGLKNASSELVEMQNVVHTVFEDLEDSVNEFADKARTTFGLTEFQAKKFTSIFGSMFKTAGTSTEAAKVMGENLTALSADLASFFDADFTDAFDKVKSGLSGMIMPLRSYGIDLSVASMKQYMLDKGIQASWADLSIAQKQMIRYNYMLERTTMMQGDFNKTIGTWANQTRILKNQLRELAVIVGAFIEKHFYPFLVGLNEILKVAVKVGRTLQETFSFTLGDIQTQQGQGEGTERGISIGTTYDEDEADATDALADSTDRLTESKKKLQKQNERQEASFDSLIKLTRKSTDTTDDNTKSTDKNKKKKVDLDLAPADYKSFKIQGKEAELPKWAVKLISWLKEVKSLFDKYSPAIKRELKELKKAWAPVLETLGKGVQWLWKNVLKPFLEWFLGTALPKTIRLATVVGGVVDSVLAPIGEAIKKLWEYPLKPFFKAIGDKYVKWVESSTDSLKAWKAQFDALDSTDAKLEFLKVSIQNFFENTIRKYFGERSEEILDQFYENFGTIGDILGNIFASTDEIAQGKLFNDEFLQAVEDLGSAFVLLGQVTFGNILGLIGTLTDNIGDVSEIGGNLADNFGKIETMVFDGVNGLLGTLINNKDSVKEASNSVTDLVTAVGSTVFKGLNDSLDKLLKSGTASDYMGIIKDALVRISELVFDNIGELIDWLGESDTKETVKNIRDNLIDAFENVTKFFQDNKDTILDFVERISEFIKFASEHPNLLVGVLIGGKLLSGLASVSGTVWNIYKGFTLLGTEGVASLGSLLGPLGLIVAILTEAYGFVMGMKEQWDNQNDSIETVAGTMSNNIKQIADLDSTVPVERSEMGKYAALLDSVGATVTSTGYIMYRNQGKFKKFSLAVKDASKLSDGEFKRLKKALVDFGAVTQAEADRMSKQDVVDKMYEQVNLASGRLAKTMRENGQTIKDLTAESAQDISSWTDDVWSRVTDSIDEEKWFNKLGQGWDLVSGDLKETIGKGTSEIAQMTGELPAAVINDINSLLKNGATTDVLETYFENYKNGLKEVSDTTDDAAQSMSDASDTMSDASDSFTESTKEVQKSADEVNLDEAIESINDLADAYENATDASNNMKLSSSIDKLKEYYAQLYANGKISAEEYGAELERLVGYKEDLKKATSGVIDVLRDSRQSGNKELKLFSDEFIDSIREMQEGFGDDIQGFRDFLKSYIDNNTELSEEQKKVFYESIFPILDSVSNEGIPDKIKENAISIRDAGIDAANKEVDKKLDLEATVPDKDSPEAAKAEDKAEERGKSLSKKLKKGAQEEANKGKLSTETYINNGSADNKKAAEKQGIVTVKDLIDTAQKEVDTHNIGMNKLFDNSSSANKAKAKDTGSHFGKEVKKSAQEEVNNGKLSAVTYLNNGSAENKASASKQGIDTAKELANAAQKEVDIRNIGMSKMFDNASGSNKSKAEETGSHLGKETKKGAQEEVNKGKLSTETYINNGSENNKEVAKKEGTKTGKILTDTAQEYVDNKSITVGTSLENAEAENKAKATKEGNKAGATAVSTMQNTVSSSKVNLADSLDIQITQNKVLYVAACIQNLLVSAMSRIHTIDLSSKFSFSGSSQNLPLAYSAPVYTSGRMGNLPHLAKGAVIPPRSKFLAVLGDQRSGYNIETPLDTMIDAFKIALQDTGLLNKGSDQPIQLTVQIGSEKLDDRIVNVVDSRNTRSGGL